MSDIVFESAGADTLFVEIVLVENGRLRAALKEARRQRDEAQREEAALGAQNAKLKELLIPARDMIIGFSFGKDLAADIDAALAGSGDNQQVKHG